MFKFILLITLLSVCGGVGLFLYRMHLAANDTPERDGE